MFNMLIAIMGDTFDKIMEYREINATKSKLELMCGLVASLGPQDELQNEKIFLFLVQPEQDEDNEEEEEWEGTIKTLTRLITRSDVKMTKNMRAMNANQQRLEQKMNANQQKLEQKMDEKMDAIQATLSMLVTKPEKRD